MNSENDSLHWREKYKSIKKKYQELLNIRVNSVIEDSNELRKKIEEHKQVHQATIEEIQNENAKLENRIKAIQNANAEIEDIEDNIESIKRKLRVSDSILAVIIEHPKLHTRCPRSGVYIVSCGVNDEIKFELKKEERIIYSPINIPKIENAPDFIYKECSLRKTQLNNLCDHFDAILPQD